MADAPKRIQRRRTRGWRMPAGAIYVGRPTKWGNHVRIDPAEIEGTTPAEAWQRELWGYKAELTSVDWAPGESYTVIAKPGQWSSTVTITRKPRKRRHYRQVVY